MHNRRARLIPLLILVTVVWGGGWVSGKLLATSAPAWTLSFWRFVFSFLSFLPVTLIRRESLALPRSVQPWMAAGVAGLLINNVFFFIGLSTQLAGKGGVIGSASNPLSAFLLAILFFGVRPPLLQLFGLVLGLAGGAVMLRLGIDSPQTIIASGVLDFFAVGAGFGLLTVASGQVQKKLSVFAFGAWLYLAGAVVSGLVACATAREPGLAALLPPGLDWRFWANTFYMGIVNGTLATTVYFVASRELGSSRTSSFTFLVPVFALILSGLFLGETPEPASLIGGALALSAVYIINREGLKSGRR
jgi:drug/metabolite transporter (DMT)-like permease